MRNAFFGLIALVLVIAIYSSVTQISSAVPLSVQTGATTQPTNDAIAWHNIPFQLGQKQFQNGDRVQITAVRCTAEQLQMGELMQVKGTYDLNSSDEADLCLFMTATDGNGKGPIYPQQTISVKRGHGEFTLREPITCRGWPHVSFYDKGSGENVGGVYFGYGEWLHAEGGKGEDRVGK